MDNLLDYDQGAHGIRQKQRHKGEFNESENDIEESENECEIDENGETKKHSTLNRRKIWKIINEI